MDHKIKTKWKLIIRKFASRVQTFLVHRDNKPVTSTVNPFNADDTSREPFLASGKNSYYGSVSTRHIFKRFKEKDSLHIISPSLHHSPQREKRCSSAWCHSRDSQLFSLSLFLSFVSGKVTIIHGEFRLRISIGRDGRDGKRCRVTFAQLSSARQSSTGRSVSMNNAGPEGVLLDCVISLELRELL